MTAVIDSTCHKTPDGVENGNWYTQYKQEPCHRMMQHLSSNNKFSTIFICWANGALALHCYYICSVHTLLLHLATPFTSWYCYSIVLSIQIFNHSGWSCISTQHMPPSLGMKNNPSGMHGTEAL